MAEFLGKSTILILVSLALLGVMVFNLLLSCFIIHGIQLLERGLSLSENGLKFHGSAAFHDSLVASTIRHHGEHGLQITSGSVLGLKSGKENGAYIELGNDMVFVSKDFSVRSPNGNFIELQNNTILTSFKNQHIIGSTQIIGNLRTSNVESAPQRGLKLQSQTSHVYISGAEGVSIRSKVGKVSTFDALNITLSARNKIYLSASELFLNLNSLHRPLGSAGNGLVRGSGELCACTDGRLFVSAHALGCAIPC